MVTKIEPILVIINLIVIEKIWWIYLMRIEKTICCHKVQRLNFFNPQTLWQPNFFQLPLFVASKKFGCHRIVAIFRMVIKFFNYQATHPYHQMAIEFFGLSNFFGCHKERWPKNSWSLLQHWQPNFFGPCKVDDQKFWLPQGLGIEKIWSSYLVVTQK